MDRSKKHNTVVINGRVYDANTGELTDNQSVGAHTKTPSGKRQKTVDGFTRPKNPGLPKTNTKKPRNHPTPTAGKVHQKTKRSETLQRQILHKPEPTPRIASKNNTGTASKAVSDTRVVLDSHDTRLREKRASKYSLSKNISKFGQEFAPIGAVGQTNHPRGVNSPNTPLESKPAHELKNDLIKKQMSQAKPVRPNDKVQKKAVHKQSRIFGKLRARPKLVTGLATFTSIVLLAGYITYINIPNLSMRVAASRAGFNAKMPGYTPNGFAFTGPVSYAPGHITIAFNTSTDGRKYTVTQKSSNWDSRSLLDNYVDKEHELHQEYKERGLTIYVYDGSNATWVNGGVWYTIEGESDLNSEQIVKIASSL